MLLTVGVQRLQDIRGEVSDSDDPACRPPPPSPNTSLCPNSVIPVPLDEILVYTTRHAYWAANWDDLSPRRGFLLYPFLSSICEGVDLSARCGRYGVRLCERKEPGFGRRCA
jgi:hypothetical protein